VKKEREYEDEEEKLLGDPLSSPYNHPHIQFVYLNLILQSIAYSTIFVSTMIKSFKMY